MSSVRNLHRFESLLRRERAWLQALLERQPTAEPEPGGLQPNHPAEVAGSLFDREEALGLKAYLVRRLAEVDAALHRIHAGTYGRCEGCGMPIPKARLKVVPAARMRVECQERIESELSRQPQSDEALT